MRWRATTKRACAANRLAAIAANRPHLGLKRCLARRGLSAAPCGSRRFARHENRLRGTRKPLRGARTVLRMLAPAAYLCLFVSGFRPAFVSGAAKKPAWRRGRAGAGETTSQAGRRYALAGSAAPILRRAGFRGRSSAQSFRNRYKPTSANREQLRQCDLRTFPVCPIVSVSNH